MTDIDRNPAPTSPTQAEIEAMALAIGEIMPEWIDGKVDDLDLARAAYVGLARAQPAPEASAGGVIQADREAAIDLVSPREARDIAAGACDDHMLVQAFKRHRLTTTPNTLAPEASAGGVTGDETCYVCELDRAHVVRLQKIQHDGTTPAAKPQLGGSIIAWAADEITELRATPNTLAACDRAVEDEWQPIETAPKTIWLKAQHVLCAHAEKKWIRFGRFYGEFNRWYYSGTTERTQWAEVQGDAPTHWMPIPVAPDPHPQPEEAE